MKKFSLYLLAVLIASTGFIYRVKHEGAISPAKQALLAHTWRMETVFQHKSTNTQIIYRRGAPASEEDLSAVRLTCKSNGTIQYVDENGARGNNARYQLTDNDKKIRISYAGLNITGENVVVNGNQFAYTVKYNNTDSSRFVYSPIWL